MKPTPYLFLAIAIPFVTCSRDSPAGASSAKLPDATTTRVVPAASGVKLACEVSLVVDPVAVLPHEIPYMCRNAQAVDVTPGTLFVT